LITISAPAFTAHGAALPAVSDVMGRKEKYWLAGWA